jgi:hypothetical protein
MHAKKTYAGRNCEPYVCRSELKNVRSILIEYFAALPKCGQRWLPLSR